MRLVDISVDRFGILQQGQLPDLARGLTVIYGGNGSGKTTLVSFLRGILFGFTSEHLGYHADDLRFGGTVTIESRGRSLRVTRECVHGISSELSIVDLATGRSVPAGGLELPEWVNEPVFQEIFTVGYQEAARFDLLTRLCLGSPQELASEIAQTERALQQCVNERQGLPGMPEEGFESQLSNLYIAREQYELALAKRQQAGGHDEIASAELEGEVHRLYQMMASIDARIRSTDDEIRYVEQQLADLEHRNTVPLDRRALEERREELLSRIERWNQIEQSARQEFCQTPDALQPAQESLRPLRALTQRLESRVEALTRPELLNVGTGDTSKALQDLRSEIFALCDYLAAQEASTGILRTAAENQRVERVLQEAEFMQDDLRRQIQDVERDLGRCDDVLGGNPRLGIPEPAPGLGCLNHAHAEHLRYPESHSGAADLELQLRTLKSRTTDLQLQRQASLAMIEDNECRLETDIRTVQAVPLEQLDQLRALIAEVEEEIKSTSDRIASLRRTEDRLTTLLEQQGAQPDAAVLDLASGYLSRLTGGQYGTLSHDEDGTGIMVTGHDLQQINIRQLSRGIRDLLALSLRLALVQARAHEDGRAPLILDDVFMSADNDAANATVDLLLEISESGQQIIFLTSQADVSQVFKKRDVPIRLLAEPEIDEARPPIAAPRISTPEPEPEPATPPSQGTSTRWLFYLEMDNSIEDLSGLTVAELHALRGSGIETIDQLLSVSSESLSDTMMAAGYTIGRERVEAWRGQAELSALVPMLRRRDAEMIYASGIHTSLELSRMRPESVFEIVTRHQETTAGHRFLRSGMTIDRQQAINWSRSSQHSRTIEEARKCRSCFFGTAAASEKQSERQRSSDSGITRRQPRPEVSAESALERERRRKSRQKRISRRTATVRAPGAPESEQEEVRFYLNRTDDVEAAPSIGPKTAQRLYRLDIYTVDDLLTSDAENVSESLENRRVNTRTVEQWQKQASLMCQVPGLRGHDSQILVACGVVEAAHLAAKRPTDLLAVVGPFAETSEGERILRGGRKPDLEEVTDWITWAQHSRPLRSAA